MKERRSLHGIIYPPNPPSLTRGRGNKEREGVRLVNNIKVASLLVDKSGSRLDKYVSQHYPELSRTQVQKLIGEGYIKVNDHDARAGLKLNAGDRLTINL